MELLKNQWPGEWNCDLICEIPGQTREDALNDWRILKAYGPPHLSLYTLSIEENTPLRRRIDEGELSEKIDEGIWFLFKSRLAIDGYRQYEVSNHHREGGAVCLHNIRYWRMRPYLGLGPGAVSTLRAKDRIVRLENPPQLARYLSLPPGTAFLQETLSSRILLSELLIMGLRVNEGLSMAEINRIYGVPLEAILPKWFAHGISEGLLQVEEDRLRTAGRGTLFLNSLLSSALEELDSPGVFLTDSPNWP